MQRPQQLFRETPVERFGSGPRGGFTWQREHTNATHGGTRGSHGGKAAPAPSPRVPERAQLQTKGPLAGAHARPRGGLREGAPTPTQAHSGHADEQTAHGVTYLRHTDTSTCRKGQRGTATSHVRGTHAHTTDVHARRHSVHSKDKDTVSPHPHITTHKHANRSTHTGGCCAAPTSTCGVFAFCLFWERETDRFSAPSLQSHREPAAACRPAGSGAEAPARPHGLHGPLASADAQPSTLQGRGVTPGRVQTRGSASYSGQAETRRLHVPRH